VSVEAMQKGSDMNGRTSDARDSGREGLPSHIPGTVTPREPLGEILKGQKALVTGGTSGIGRAVALALAEAGADVAVNHLSDSEAVAEVVDALEAAGATALSVQGDVSSEEDVERMISESCDALGTIDILVNNAGIQKDARFADMTLDEWNDVIGVNLTGQFLCARAAVREFLAHGDRTEVCAAAGKIIGISSVHDVIPWAGHVNYAASKGGAQLMMKSIAQELAPYRIRVNSVAPGAIRTPINEQAWRDRDDYEELVRLIPAGRIGEAEDVARAVVWLASDHADYVTGATLYVDGGMQLYPGFSEAG